MRLRVLILSLILVFLTACNIAAGTPYESRQACERDKQCAKEFREYQDCTVQYETGC